VTKMLRWLTAAVVLAVAAFAAVVSYSHIYDLGRANGQLGTAGRLLPLSVDGLIVAASLVLLHEARNGRTAPPLARMMLWLGIGATVAANVAYGAAYGPLGAVISAWPAVGFIGAAEMAIGMVRRSRHQDARAGAGIPPAAPVLAQDAETAAMAAYTASVTGGNPLSQNQLQARFRLSRAQATKVRREVLAESNGHAPDGT
jgi:Protein of unknown function (DUF2637)